MSRPKTQARIASPESGGRASDRAGAPPAADEGGSDADLLGTVIDGRYRILELIGRGGMGAVFKAEHTGIRRQVALKLLHPSLARIPEVSRRFEREAFAIGRIEHPNCVNVSDFGQLDDGSLYLVMEYLEGRSLGDELAEQPRIEPHRAAHILRHVLRGLGHAHDNEIVHRDVKPENVVLVEQDGDPNFAKILDFGIAKLVGSAAQDDGGAKLTQAGMAFGTPVYMSPEQAVGNPIDGRADLYAASVMAYEMITGKPPFQSDDKIEIMSMHTSKPVPPMNEVAPDVTVPPAIEQVIARGLAKRPEERYASAAEYVAAIDAVLGDTRRVTTSANMPLLTTTGTGPLLPGRPSTAAGHVPTPHTTHPGIPAQSTHPGIAVPAARRSRRRRITAAAAVALVLVLIAVVAQLSGPSGTLADRAAEKLSQGDPKGAIELLESKPEAIAENASAQLQLGHAHALARDDAAALEAYRRALELDPQIADDGQLRANLSVMSDGKNSAIAVKALAFMISDLDDEAARDKLVEMASADDNDQRRHLAAAAAEELGLGDQVDWVQSYILDLRQNNGCRERRKAVPKLRKLGDKRAIPALKRAAYRKGRRGRWKGKPINRCLKQAALEAAEYLEGLPADDAEPE